MNGCIYRTKDNECERWADDKSKSFCDIETCKDRVMSNADRIRSMTDEELATTMHDMTLISTEIGLSAEWWLQWLKSPVEVSE